MKKFQILVILAAFCICQSADSQTPSDIHVLQATYGAGTQQMDVTAKVQSLVQGGQPNIQVRSQLFGKDPSFGKVKTLTILFTSNGVQYRTDLREGELLAFSNAHAVSATATPGAPAVQEEPPSPSPPASAQLEATAPQNHRLAPEGTLFLLKYFAVKSGSSVIGVLPGTRLKLLKDLGETMQVKTVDEYKMEFEVDTDKLTNDIDLAEWAKKNDEKSQDDYMKRQKDNYLAEQAKLNPLYAQQAEEADARRKAASSVGGRTTKLDGGAYDEHYSVPWWYHGRPFIYRVHR